LRQAQKQKNTNSKTTQKQSPNNHQTTQNQNNPNTNTNQSHTKFKKTQQKKPTTIQKPPKIKIINRGKKSQQTPAKRHLRCTQRTGKRSQTIGGKSFQLFLPFHINWKPFVYWLFLVEKRRR
jgi:hypothetical protein